MGKLCLSTAGDGCGDGVSDDLRGLILRGLNREASDMIWEPSWKH